MPYLALLRHGQSRWNLENRFTGWVDIDLTPEGEAQARRAGQLLAATGAPFDQMFTSVLKRAIRTGTIALETMDAVWLPVEKDWRLNERHYGALTGLNKEETAGVHGADQVRIWRRSYDVPPPPLAPGGEYDFARDRRYAGLAALPQTESLKSTLERVLPYWDAALAPALRAGRNLIVAAHGNSLRAIVKHLYGLSDEAIIGVEIPVGNPLLIDLGPTLAIVSARYLDEARAERLPAPAPA
jgi:2,3-bisphosphoglycerate-dependent phosphoglycerate mutase